MRYGFAARACALLCSLSVSAFAQTETVQIDSGTLSGLGARNIGSAAMSGRISALAGYTDANGKVTLFVGSASGGVWKSTDGATTFKPVFDDQPVQSIGAIALDPSNPRNVWVGSGEAWTRNSVSVGDGIYKSTDGGETWMHVGLPDSERISRIIVDPRAADTVYACVPGKLWSDSAERGLYRSADGGKTWTELTGQSNKGLPPKPYGRIALAFAPSDARTVYAFVESTDSALLISHDGGATWERGDKSQWMVWRPFYFANLVVDPKDANRVFKTDGSLILSEDGGKSFSTIGGFAGMHGDVHDVFIDPSNSQHVFAGDDGGLWISFDGANKWWKTDNLPISQFYHVSLDNADPYRIYGGLQDNSSWIGDSAYPSGITS